MPSSPQATQRFFVAAEGVDDDAVRVGFRWLFAFCREHGFHRAAVLVPTLAQATNLGRAIGQNVADQLRRARSVEVDGIIIELVVAQNRPRFYEDGPLLAVWVDDKELSKLDVVRAPALCAIPWLSTDIAGWKSDWNPIDLRTGAPGGSEQTVSNAVVAQALESLTQRVNLSTGLAHPSDKDSAVGLFRLLREAGEEYDPAQVRAWAVRRGWDPTDARDLADVASKIKAGRQIRTATPMWSEGIIERWRADASSR